MADGNFKISDLNSTVLEFSKDTQAVFEIGPYSSPEDSISYLLRNRFGNPDLGQALLEVTLSKNFDKTIEVVRNHLVKGELNQADQLLKALNPITQSEKEEYLLEVARFLLFSAKPKEVISYTNQSMLNNYISPCTKMTVYQVRADCFVRIGELNSALEEIQKGLLISRLFPKAKSYFSLLAFNVTVLSKLGRVEEAKKQLAELQEKVSQIPFGVPWLARKLYELRAQVHLFRALSDERNVKLKLLEARLIAQWLPDDDTLKKCDADLKLLESVQIQESEVKVCFRFDKSVYLSRMGVILSNNPKRLYNVNDSELCGRVFSTLILGKKSYEDLFKEIWGLKYSSERHINTVKMTISRLRKLLPPDSIQVSGGEIEIIKC